MSMGVGPRGFPWQIGEGETREAAPSPCCLDIDLATPRGGAWQGGDR